MNHPYFTWKKEVFDHVIIDEASQMLEPVCYAGIRLGKEVTLAGDYWQLGPVVKCAGSVLETSLFEKMCKSQMQERPQNVTTLKLQYRMNQKIQDFVNRIIYEPKGIKLEAATEMVANNYIDNTNSAIHKVYCDDPANQSRNVTNQTEVDSICGIIQNLICDQKVTPERIGVIAPYNAQVQLIQDTIHQSKEHQSDVEVSTIDKYQGRQKDIIIVSLVHPQSILYEWRRFHVAITRAKQCLYLVGHSLDFDHIYDQQ